MPHGKQQNRRTNAKKKGRDNCSTTPPTPQNENANARVNMSKKDMDRFMRSLDQSSEERSGNDFPSAVEDSLYVRYKKCTQRFKDALQSMVPTEIFQCDSVNALIMAAEYVAENDLIVVEPQLLQDLKLAIRVRKRVALDRFAGGDKGHSHFIAVLAYCWSVLAPKRRRQMKVSKRPGINESPVGNRFEGLSLIEEDYEDQEDDSEEDLPSSPIARPEEGELSRLSLDELISGSDRMSGILFIMTLDELMCCISNHYSKLKEASVWIQNGDHPPGIVIEQMMEASVATNYAIQQVTSLEASFALDYPHLNTVYRLLACLQLVDLVPILTRIVSTKSPLAAQFSEKNAIEFLGDAMECAFRNVSDPRNRHLTLVKEFLDCWQFSDDIPAISVEAAAPAILSQESIRHMYESVPEQSITDEMAVQRIFEYVYMLVKFEAPLLREQQFCEVRKFGTSVGISSHRWLNYATFLGQDRSIVHTVRLLQSLSIVIKEQKGLLMPLGTSFYGPSWKNRQAPATKIQGDMDSLLMDDIMPSLVIMCHECLLSEPEPPVTWSLAFTFHSILTSVFDVQGSNHPFFLAESARLTYELFFQQLARTKSTHPTSIPQRLPSWDNDIESLLNLEYLPVSMFCALNSHEALAIWNPFCAGTFLSYVAYFINLCKGTSFLDAVAQLRMTLHLFNALLQRQAIRSGQIEPLDLIFKIFRECKSVWEGPLPTQGQFQKRWLITCGTKPGLAAEMQKGSPRTPRSARGRNDNFRTRTPLLAEHVSTSFRRICRRDFSGAAKTVRSACQTKGDSTSSIIELHAARVDNTWDAMQRDGQLLGTNLIALGYYLNQFYFKFLNDFGLMSKVEQLIRQGPQSRQASDERTKYHVMSLAFAKYILGPLDRGDGRVESRCVELLGEFFNDMSPDKVMWFTPIREEE